MANDVLDRNTPIPLYYQIKEILKERIISGELKPGDLVPSERELSEKYGVSRPTARQALRELVTEGMLIREKGRGTFVAEPKINYGFMQKLITFYDDMVQKGYVPRTRILRQELIRNQAIAHKLGINDDDKIIYIFRVRYLAGDPVVTVKNHIPYKLCPELINEQLEDRSLYRLLAEKYGLTAHKADVFMEPHLASKDDAKLLDIKPGAAMFLMENITYTKEGLIMDYFESHFRGDKGKLKVTLYK